MGAIPRRTVEPNADAQLSAMLQDLWTAVRALQKGAPIRNASISGGDGLSIVDEVTGLTVVQLLPDGTVVTFDDQGAPVVRMGTMVDTAGQAGSGPYGIEVRAGAGWIRLGGQTVDWSQVGNKPGTFTPSNHQHFGYDIVSAVANATQAANAARADKADGVTPEAYARVVAGVPGEWQAMYMHSNGTIGRGSSGEQYKQNIREWAPNDPAAVLALQPVLFDRKATNGDDFTPPAHTDELGLIAQQVATVDEQLVVRYQGEVDNVNWNLLPVYMLPLLRQHHTEITELRALLEQQQRTIEQQASMLKRLESALQGTTPPKAPPTGRK